MSNSFYSDFTYMDSVWQQNRTDRTPNQSNYRTI